MKEHCRKLFITYLGYSGAVCCWICMLDKGMAEKEPWRATAEGMERKQHKSVKGGRGNGQQRTKRNTYKERMREMPDHPGVLLLTAGRQIDVWLVHCQLQV